jgi:hypothetical protein
MPISRRQFLLGLGGACVIGALPLESSCAPSLSRGGAPSEAANLTDRMMRTFWDDHAGMFRAPVRSAETVDSDPAHNNGYTFWPSTIALNALADGEKAHPGRYRRRIAKVYAGLEQYWNPSLHCYTAWLNFPGQQDAYFDDNSYAASTLIEAYRATGTTAYKDRAAEIMSHFVPTGWDSSGNPGGERFGTDPTKAGTSDKTASATTQMALAALKVASVGVDVEANRRRALDALSWLMSGLRDTDNLIRDGLHAPDWNIEPTKWTYNTGTTIHAFAEHYRQTGAKSSLESAEALARAAIDHRGRLYDSLVTDLSQRYWYDSSFFVQYLIDGLVALANVTPDVDLRRAIRLEVEHNVRYALTYLRDPADGLYWRNWRLWRIGDEQLAAWNRLYGQNRTNSAGDWDDSERSKEARWSNTPVNERPLVKTLLANAGMARVFWLAG